MTSDYLVVGGCGITAFWLLSIGLRGVLIKKPFLISFSWYVVPAALLLVGGLAMQGVGLVASCSYAVTLIFVAVMWWFRPPGYTACGVTDGSLREGLLVSLTKLGLPYEETHDGLRLPTIGADLQVKGPWVSWGAGTVKMRQRRFGKVLSDIVKEMNEYYRSSSVVGVNMKNFISWLVFGGFFALWAWLAFPRVL